MIRHPIYNGAKPENPCSVFLGTFSGLLCENDDLSYAALRPTSIRLSRDAKTTTPGAGAEKIGVEPLRPPCFPDNDAIFVRGCQAARGGAKWQMQRRADASSQLPYVTKCSRSIIFANFANGAHSRILLSRTFMFAHTQYMTIRIITSGDVTLRWRTSTEALCLVKPSSGLQWDHRTTH